MSEQFRAIEEYDSNGAYYLAQVLVTMEGSQPFYQTIKNSPEFPSPRAAISWAQNEWLYRL